MYICICLNDPEKAKKLAELLRNYWGARGKGCFVTGLRRPCQGAALAVSNVLNRYGQFSPEDEAVLLETLYSKVQEMRSHNFWKDAMEHDFKAVREHWQENNIDMVCIVEDCTVDDLALFSPSIAVCESRFPHEVEDATILTSSLVYFYTNEPLENVPAVIVDYYNKKVSEAFL
jgi:hypothetical protein